MLTIPVAALQNFDEEQVINIISNNTFDNCVRPASVIYNSTINPTDQWLEALEEIKRLNAELLRVKDEQIALLKGMMK